MGQSTYHCNMRKNGLGIFIVLMLLMGCKQSTSGLKNVNGKPTRLPEKINDAPREPELSMGAVKLEIRLLEIVDNICTAELVKVMAMGPNHGATTPRVGSVLRLRIGNPPTSVEEANAYRVIALLNPENSQEGTITEWLE